ncbi:MAG: glycosyltransferase [Candidatus Ventricola sp.]
MELSLCMIVKDEEARLGRCLDSVKDAVDEIVILDTGSTDGTKAVARRYTDRVYDYAWKDDFADARNASFSYAGKPFILWLDADDVLDPDEAKKLIALKARLDSSVDAVMLPYAYAYGPDGRPSLLFERERIVRRAAGFAFSGVVHEAMAVGGHVLHEDIVVRHTGQHGEKSNRRNLSIYETWLSRGRELSARDWYYYARELKSAGETAKAEAAFAAFLGMDGWAVNRVDAQILRGECLMQLGRGQEAKRSFFAAMEHGAPRAEALCALGACFLEEEDLHAAAHWYRAALLCELPRANCAFTFPDAYGYIPLMQLCVILSRLGDDVEASKMNEQALLLRPDDPAALSNRAFFSARLAAKKD